MGQANSDIKAACFDASGTCNRQETLQCADGFKIRIKAVLGWFYQTGCNSTCAALPKPTCCSYKMGDVSLGQEDSNNQIITDQCSFQSKCFPFDSLVTTNISRGGLFYIAVDFVCEGNLSISYIDGHFTRILNSF